ncbi:Rossmann-fold NAD(P)-binding domain-containing protein [Blautia marasmi]|uniref:hypothetical protein n=1 Tax=Blautia marasmi TaxID=1917868 RepID=UPI001A9A2FD2|nr:hypothetical protein [Blautia marasmi]
MEDVRVMNGQGLPVYDSVKEATIGKDIFVQILCLLAYFIILNCRVTLEVMKLANKGAVLNPCPPFYRGEEVSEDVINSEYFVGYDFKRYLLQVQQAVTIYCLTM